MVLFLVLSAFADLVAQPYDGYRWGIDGGGNYVRRHETIVPSGIDTVHIYTKHYYRDTVQMRSELTEQVTMYRNQAVEAYAQYERLNARADSLHAVLVDLNDGFGSNDEPLKEPINPDKEYKVFRWGAILNEDETEVG